MQLRFYFGFMAFSGDPYFSEIELKILEIAGVFPLKQFLIDIIVDQIVGEHGVFWPSL